VILFAADAIEKLKSAGKIVLLEGREQVGWGSLAGRGVFFLFFFCSYLGGFFCVVPHTAWYSLEYATLLRRATLQLRALGATRSLYARTRCLTHAFRGVFQTVNYVRSPFRFTLTMSDPALIGARRAAQRVAAAAAEALGSSAEASDAAVAALIRAGLAALC
jgi:hypothetical protein